MKATRLIERFEEYCPQILAETGDPVGLNLGTLNKEIKKVLITLDVRPEVVAEAIREQVDLIFAKHPLIFRPTATITFDDPQEKMYADLLKHDVAVYIAHTNIDIVDPGLNDWFLEMLSVSCEGFLRKTIDFKGKEYGIGRFGSLPQPIKLVDFVNQVKKIFQLDGLRLISHNPQALIQKVAICGGSGAKFYPDAIQCGADVYLTGDVYYHTGHDMIAHNLHVIDPGHHIEVEFVPRLLKMFNDWRVAENWDVEFIASKENTNPFVYY